MEILIPVLALALLVVASVVFGADSRPTDEARPTQWYPANPNS
jgi:hypothetical protein